MQFQSNISLKPFNTFGIDVSAQYFSAFDSLESLQTLIDQIPVTDKILPLGGGSNILFTKDVEGYVLLHQMKGIEVVEELADAFIVEAAGGEIWHDFVLYCIRHQYAGVENLSLIPGCVGASPMQNIGAYGVEIKDVFHSLKAFHLPTKQIVHFSKSDCGFGYRESVFKKQFKNQFIILSVQFKLNKTPQYNTSYGAIEQELERMQITTPTLDAVSQAVINIRQSKLPNPKEIGNAGSFFKNPVITIAHYNELQTQFATIPGYAVDEIHIKVPAGWLIEHSGPTKDISWKGYRLGDVGCHQKQALVIVNYGNASGQEIFLFSERIIDSVYQKFNIQLEREVNIL